MIQRSNSGCARVDVVICFSSDPVFVARMLVNEIQMIKSIDFAKQEENRKQVRAGNSAEQGGILESRSYLALDSDERPGSPPNLHVRSVETCADMAFA